jgi:hypothetical protein
MDYKSKCVNLLNKLAYEVCNVKKEQNEIVDKLNINNEILLFTNALNQEILGINVCYKIAYEVYDLVGLKCNKLFYYLLCNYLNSVENYNFYFPSYVDQSFVNVHTRPSIVRVVLIPSQPNMLRETISTEKTLEHLQCFINYLEEQCYNSKKTREVILKYLENFECLNLSCRTEKNLSKPSSALKNRDMVNESICTFINNNVCKNNLICNLYNDIVEILEISKLELVEAYVSDVNNAYKEEITRKRIVENAYEVIRNREMETDNFEPFEPSDIDTFTDTIQDFEFTQEDTNGNINKEIFNKLKNILDISTNTEFDTETDIN